MARKVRKQVYLTAEQNEALKQRARELGTTGSDLIRRGIDQVLRLHAAQPVDRMAWRQELEFIRERAKLPALGGARTWTREELNEERLEGHRR